MSSYLSSLLWGTSQLDDAIDKATSELLPSGSEDIALNLEICDQIRSKSVPPKDAMRALKRRLNHKNPNVQLLALSLTDVCVKNGGDLFLNEVASREFMDNFVSILKIPALNHDVKNKILRYIQDWALAFEGKPSLSYVGEVYKSLQREGFNFPPRDPALTSSAMVDTQTAPEWIDSEYCLRCREPFTFTNRKHHCRNCGWVVDHQCSNKTIALPHFGIAQEVRVCNSCYTTLTKKNKVHRSSQSVSGSRHRHARDIADADLQRAIQLSLEEVGAAGGRRPGYVPSPSSWQTSEPPLVDRAGSRYAPAQEEDPDLRAAIEASLREANAPKPSAPIVIDASDRYMAEQGPGYPQSYPPSSATPKPRMPTIPSYDLEPLEADAIMTFNQTVDQLQAQGGRDISMYPAVTVLYDRATALRPKLAMNLNDTSRKEQLLVDMHEKLSQAVKLYDNLLTEQLSRPSWRAAPVLEASPYGPQYQQSADVSTYGQWQAGPQTSAQQASPPTQAQTPPYFSSAPPAPQQSHSVSYEQQQQMYQPQTTPVLSPSSPSVSLQRYGQENAPYTAMSSPPVSVPQYGAPPTPVSYQPNPTPAQAPPQFQQPPPQQQQQQQYSPALSRYNTVTSYRPTHAAQPPVRANTVAQPMHTSSQLLQLQQTSVPLPSFPQVPNAHPQHQAYDAYGGSAPEPERKEALLIDL
ncbi:hypothetical protein BC628DRAFT_1374595 [Trametes gibbosa]|uniref:Vacuolar protein sorting-associated protein 27 n=1 Tax=Trametes gibbosa TaxID=160864 RepID=A0A6G6FQL9_9APHY|nr:hypothetical protein BC628DRAFT_1374595 [Trametes gibbosa]QIE48544.1 hypothetical protein [Trametes gibbosa]